MVNQYQLIFGSYVAPRDLLLELGLQGARLLLDILETLLRSLQDVSHRSSLWIWGSLCPKGKMRKMLSSNELKLVSCAQPLKTPMFCHCGGNPVKTLCWWVQKHLRMIGILAAIDLNRLVSNGFKGKPQNSLETLANTTQSTCFHPKSGVYCQTNA